MEMFRDRRDAGRKLAAALAQRTFDRPVVLGIPRGGVVVSVEVASALQADHGVVVARKLGAPYQPELAIGAVTASGVAFIDRPLAEQAGADERYLRAVRERETAEARRREEAFDGRRRPSVAGRDVIVVDDGVATGATAIAAVRAMRAQQASRVTFAVPVGPPHTVDLLRREADDVVCLQEEPDFFAVGQFYHDFEPVDDAEVRALLAEHEAARRAPAGQERPAQELESRDPRWH